MAKLRILSREEVKEMYPKPKKNGYFSPITKKVWKILNNTKNEEVVFVLVKDSKFSKISVDDDWTYKVKVCCDSLMGNKDLIPGKSLKFNCIVDDTVTDTECLAICYSYPT